ncbi:MAG: hypothetical protein ACTHZ9_03365 [Leucobacter sp.]
MENTRIIFGAPGLMSVNANPYALKALSKLPEWEDLRTSYANVASHFDVPPAPDLDDAVDRLIAGADLHELALERANARTQREPYVTAADEIQRSARTTHDTRVRRIIDTSKKRLSAAILDEYDAIKAEAVALLPGLGTVRTLAEAVESPDHVAAFARLKQLTTELEKWQATWRLLSGFNPRLSTRWTHLDLIADYPQAWPHFHRYETVFEYLDDSRTYSVPAEPEPWTDTVDVLRDIAARDLQMWAPTKEQHEAERERLQRLAFNRQTEDLKAVKRRGAA